MLFRSLVSLVVLCLCNIVFGELPIQEIWSVELDDPATMLKSVPNPDGEGYLYLIAVENNRVYLVDSTEVIWISEEFESRVTAIHACDFTQEGNLTVLVNTHQGNYNELYRISGDNFEESEVYDLSSVGRAQIKIMSEVYPGEIDPPGMIYTVLNSRASWWNEGISYGYSSSGLTRLFNLHGGHFIGNGWNTGFVTGSFYLNRDEDEELEWITIGYYCRYEYYYISQREIYESNIKLCASGRDGSEQRREILDGNGYDYSRVTNIAFDTTGDSIAAFCIAQFARNDDNILNSFVHLNPIEFTVISDNEINWMQDSYSPDKLFTFTVDNDGEPVRYFLFSSYSMENQTRKSIELLVENDMADPVATERYAVAFDFDVRDFDNDGNPEMISYENDMLSFYEFDFYQDDVMENMTPVPSEFGIQKVYPNPFNSECSIEYSINSPTYASIKIYNLNGIEVASLGEIWHISGYYHTVWDGSELPVGKYFVELSSSDLKAIHPVLLLK